MTPLADPDEEAPPPCHRPSFAAMAPELETFFRDVMVMVDDEGLRKNRMSLLRKIGSSVEKIADLTKIVVARRDYR